VSELETLAIDFIRARDNHEQATDDYVGYHRTKPKFDKDKQTKLQEAYQTTGSEETRAFIALRDYVHEFTAIKVIPIRAEIDVEKDAEGQNHNGTFACRSTYEDGPDIAKKD
jgi:hypothetical protein